MPLTGSLQAAPGHMPHLLLSVPQSRLGMWKKEDKSLLSFSGQIQASHPDHKPYKVVLAGGAVGLDGSVKDNSSWGWAGDKEAIRYKNWSWPPIP